MNKMQFEAFVEAMKETLRLLVFAAVAGMVTVLLDFIPQLDLGINTTMILTMFLRVVDKYLHRYGKTLEGYDGESRGLVPF